MSQQRTDDDSFDYTSKHTHTITIMIMTSSYDMWFTAGGAIRIAHYDVIDDVITRKYKQCFDTAGWNPRPSLPEFQNM